MRRNVLRSISGKRLPQLLTILPIVLAAACGGGGGGDAAAPANPDAGEWLVPTNLVTDGGPGKDGIPALQNPQFSPIESVSSVSADDLVLIMQDGDQVKIYPEDILDWHEVVNETASDEPYILSYCPLTASAVAWVASELDSNPTFGVSGLLFNSNLILYDRQTDSHWSQMLQKSVNGPRIREVPTGIPVLETSFSTATQMYPDAMVMTRNTGHSRNYDRYPYGSYREDTSLLFSVARRDNRLHEKRLAIGIHDDTDAKVYQLDAFGSTTQTINDQFKDQPIVVVGNSELKLAAIYSRVRPDGTFLVFSALQDQLPNIMTDTEGNVWDVFGNAVSGPRVGEKLAVTRSYSAMWFAWAAHFDSVQIHFN